MHREKSDVAVFATIVSMCVTKRLKSVAVAHFVHVLYFYFTCNLLKSIKTHHDVHFTEVIYFAAIISSSSSSLQCAFISAFL